MALRGSNKELSVRHEQFVANAYAGVRSRSSGSAITDEGDVHAEGTLFECKVTAAPSTLLRQFEKVADEASTTLKQPALALRFYSPESALSDAQGWVDLVVRLLSDDLLRCR